MTHLDALHNLKAERLSCGALLYTTLQPRMLQSLQRQHFCHGSLTLTKI